MGGSVGHRQRFFSKHTLAKVSNLGKALYPQLFCFELIFDPNLYCRIDQCPDKSHQDSILPKNCHEFVGDDIENETANSNDHKVVHEFSKIFGSAHVNLLFVLLKCKT
jgi:hypothetical protein